MDEQTDGPKPICPLNFFEIVGITMHKCSKLWPWQAQFMVILSFNLPSALLLVKENICAKLFSNIYINVVVMAQTSSIYGHFTI